MIYRWDEKAAELLPESLRAFYTNLIGTTNEIMENLKNQNNKNAEAVRDLVSCPKHPHSMRKHIDLSNMSFDVWTLIRLYYSIR